MPSRDRPDIIARILDVAKDGGANKTKIMYAAELSHNQMKEYLSLLLHNSLLSHNNSQKVYKTTDKGFAFLESYTEISQLLESPKIEQNTSL